jgi:putative spermidine/putrescine transport system substrate-binding protein
VTTRTSTSRRRRTKSIAAMLATAVVALAANAGASTHANVNVPPTQGIPPLASIGKGEKSLHLIAPQGYAQSRWVLPFQKTSGCNVNVTYARSVGDAVSLMAHGGGRKFDLAAVDGEGAQELIYGGNVKPVNVELVSSWKGFHVIAQSPGANTIGGYHYGVSYQFGPNALLYETSPARRAPTSWSVLYAKINRGKVTVADSPWQIADAAMYLSKSRPTLNIHDPFELTRVQFTAALGLLKAQRTLVKRYWAFPAQAAALFERGSVAVGDARPSVALVATSSAHHVGATIPKEGSTWWLDSWLLATKAPHPNCAYMWMKWVSTPKVQAEQALLSGSVPISAAACAQLDRLAKHGCVQHHAGWSEHYLSALRFWHLPLVDCGNGRRSCVSNATWQRDWKSIAPGS